MIPTVLQLIEFLDSDRIVVGTEEGLYGVELTDDGIQLTIIFLISILIITLCCLHFSVAVLLVEKEKRVYQLEVIPDEQLVAVLSGEICV